MMSSNSYKLNAQQSFIILIERNKNQEDIGGMHRDLPWACSGLVTSSIGIGPTCSSSPAPRDQPSQGLTGCINEQ
jgi:hypothetical protein